MLEWIAIHIYYFPLFIRNNQPIKCFRKCADWINVYSLLMASIHTHIELFELSPLSFLSSFIFLCLPASTLLHTITFHFTLSSFWLFDFLLLLGFLLMLFDSFVLVLNTVCRMRVRLCICHSWHHLTKFRMAPFVNYPNSIERAEIMSFLCAKTPKWIQTPNELKTFVAYTPLFICSSSFSVQLFCLISHPLLSAFFVRLSFGWWQTRDVPQIGRSHHKHIEAQTRN